MCDEIRPLLALRSALSSAPLQQTRRTGHRVERMIADEIFWLQLATDAAFQTADAEASAERRHPGLIPYCAAKAVSTSIRLGQPGAVSKPQSTQCQLSGTWPFMSTPFILMAAPARCSDHVARLAVLFRRAADSAAGQTIRIGTA